ARCHDHKFDPIPQTDYYALAGIFRSTETYSGVGPGTKTARDKDLLTLAATNKRKESEEQEAREKEIDKLEEQIADLRKSQAAAKAQKTARGKAAKAAAPTKAARKEVQDQIKKLDDRRDELEAASKSSAERA